MEIRIKVYNKEKEMMGNWQIKNNTRSVKNYMMSKEPRINDNIYLEIGDVARLWDVTNRKNEYDFGLHVNKELFKEDDYKEIGFFTIEEKDLEMGLKVVGMMACEKPDKDNYYQYRVKKEG